MSIQNGLASIGMTVRHGQKCRGKQRRTPLDEMLAAVIASPP